MRRDARFWRNVTLIALVHAAGVIVLLRWASGSKIASAQEITWLSNAAESASTNDAGESIKESPTPEPTRKPTPMEEIQPVSTPAKSDIQLPAVTPPPTPSPSATTTPKPLQKPSPKSSPKKKSSPKPRATPEKKKPSTVAASAKKKETAKKATENKAKAVSANSENKSGDKSGKAGNGAGGHASGGTGAGAGWYGNMLHDRFYREWAQPTTVVASGVKLSALVKIRIEKDGRISDFKIVRPSGNVVVDESIAAVAKKVTRVDALPAGLGNGEHYDVNVNFALNSE